MDPAELERLIDGALRKLPAPHAPRTLLRRVLAAADARAHGPWYTREWFTWPLGWQAASITAAIALLTGIAMLLPEVAAVVTQSPIVIAVRVVWRAVLAPVVPFAFGLVLLMCLACAVFGTALNHLVFGRALR
jgi:hypothetical protein